MKKFGVLLFLLLFKQNLFSQVLYQQEICQCGVTGAGFSTALGSGDGFIDVYIEPGSNVIKATLFSIRFGNAPDTTRLNFHGVNLLVDNPITHFEAYGISQSARNISVNAIDVTSLINPTITSYSIEIPYQDDCTGCSYNCVYLYVIYENPSIIDNISSSVYLNNINEANSVVYATDALNPVLVGSPISFATYLDRLGSEPNDGSYLSFFNGSVWTNLGLLKGTDQINSSWDGAAVKGHFYYQNNQMFGLDDDTPDLIVGGSDGLMNASSYLLPNNTLKWSLDWETNSSMGRYNIYNGFFVNHSTLCIPFPVTTPKDTTVCQNSTLQLNATGGTPNSHSASGYEWQPATGLSCTDCPNPVFTADSSMFYTVRIWNTDSCSVVRPLKINVRPQPVWNTVTVDSTICGASTGAATLFAQPNNSIVQSWTEVGGATQTTNVFQNLSGGNHTFYFTDTNGCQSTDTVIFIPSTKPTVASFTANPISGASPLSVDFVNTSQQATNYEWSVNGINLGNSLPNFVFDSTGNYWVELVAWQNDPVCADTFVLLIIAYDSLVLQIPNVFSPNGDGTNDAYTLTSNVPVSVDYSIVNRWGQTMIAQTVQFGPGKTVLWDALNSSTELTEGTYFYVIEATPTFDNGVIGKTVKLSGFLQLVR